MNYLTSENFQLDSEILLLKSFLDYLPFGISITNAQGILVYYNDLNGQIEGLKKEQVLGKHISEVYAPSTESSPTLAVLKTGQPVYDLVIVYKTSFSKVITASHTALPLIKNNKVIGCLCLQEQIKTSGSSHSESQHIAKQKILFNSMIGGSQSFRDSINAALSAADTPSSVLIYGETGSGKELLARQLHEQSQRASRPYVAINCSAIPPNLLEATLFGSVKGAYTGAENTPGLFEVAHGGTLYLDELDSMPMELQPKLLRVIQERKVRRVGSIKEQDVNIKLISSFSCDPIKAVQDGRVRADLFYRLSVVMIQIPPLRERRGDLHGLLSFFLNKHGAILKKKSGGIDSDVLTVLNTYSWPGNVRELENIVEGALNLIKDGETIGLKHFPPYFRQGRSLLAHGCSNKQTNKDARDQPAYCNTERPRAAKAGRNDVVEALENTRGNITEASRILGLSRQVLSYKMKKYGIKRQDFTEWE